ncbi:MAG: hypothetical protein AAFX94_09045 [Myxococcota bacterium]
MPTLDEGFEAVERIPFTPATRGAGRPALVVDVDQYLLDPQLRPREGVEDRLREWADRFFVCGVAWRPPGTGSRSDVQAAIRALPARLGIPFEVVMCPHPPGPPRCWCRRPLPGLGLLLEHRHQLDLRRSFLLGSGAANAGFASRLGMTTIDPEGLRANLEPPPSELA